MQLSNFWYYLLWAGAVFLIMRFGCGSHIMGHGHHHDGHDQDHGLGSSGPLLPPEKAADPVCGMTVQTAAAKSSAFFGHVYYFCSQKCREKFEAAPASYAKATTTIDKKEQHHGGC
jgi:YHS domain-containing protein